MKCRIVKLAELSGMKASVYSVIINDSNKTLFENFLSECKNSHKSEINDILIRLRTIGNDTGARYSFFKHHEGVPGDGVVALYDLPGKKLRLYGIRYGTDIIIVGGGGPKEVRALQDKPKLMKENYLLRKISKAITNCVKNKDITFSDNRLDFEGKLEIEIEDHE